MVAPWAANVNWWGVFFIVGGALWFLGEMGVFRFSWSVLGPLALVAVGLTMLFGGGWSGKGHGDDCTCTCACCAEGRA